MSDRLNSEENSRPKLVKKSPDLEQFKTRIQELEAENRQLQQALDKREKALRKGQQIEEILRQRTVQLSNQNAVLTELARNKALHQGDLKVALTEITESTAYTLATERVSVWLYDETQTHLRCLDLFGLTLNQHSEGLELAIADYPAYFQALAENKLIAAHDAHTDPRTCEFSQSYLTPLGITSMLDTPIRFGGQIVGVVCIERIGENSPWTAEEENFAGSIADLVSLVLEARDRQRTAAALKESEERWQLALYANNDGIWDWNLQTNEIFYSERWKAMLGYEDWEITNNHDEWTKRVHPEDLERVTNAFDAHLNQKTTYYKVEYRLRCKDGSYKWIQDRGKSLRDEKGNPIRVVGSHTDISDRKKAEEALQQQAQKDSLLGSISQRFLNQDIDTAIDFTLQALGEFTNSDRAYVIRYSECQKLLWMTYEWNNDGIQSITEDFQQLSIETFPWFSQQLLSGKSVKLDSLSDLPTEAKPEKAHLESDGTQSMLVVPMINADKAVGYLGLDVLHSTKIWTEEDVNLVKLVGEFIAIAQAQQQAETALQESQARLSGILDNVNEAIISVDEKQRITLFNHGAEQTFGYTASEVLGQPFELLLPTRFAEIHHQHVKDFGQTSEIARKMGGRLPVFGRRRDGSEFMAEVSISQLNLGGRKIFTAVVRDITERQQAEEALRESQQKLQAILDNSPTVVYLKDCQGYYLLVNHQFENLFHLTTEQIIGKTDAEIFPHEIAVALRANDRQVIAEGESLYFEEIVPQDDGIHTYLSIKFPLYDTKGNVYGVCGISTDISDRKKSESELNRAKEAAETANRAKSEFLASMSHELRTPLNAILGFTQVMNRDSSLSNEQQQNLGIISRSGEHLLELINDILEMSKIEAGRTTLNENSFDIYRLLDSLEEMLRLKADAKGLQMIFERTPDVPQYVKTDEGKLRQVLINLVGNAIKFTAEGGVILRGKTINDGHLLFEIEDTGPGIAPEEIDKLFEAFGQTETGRKSQQGTGLGLPISQKFVQLMGGNIRVSSVLGQGTMFSFDIQISLADPSEVQTNKQISKVIGLAPDQPEYRILAVDDRLESRMLLVKLLTNLGFSVREAANGQEAIEQWESWSPHLIWMDMRMPVMDGYEATKQIKATIKGQATVIIALTASAFEEERTVVLSAGCDDFMRKPFREEVLLDKMAKHLGVRYVYEEEQLLGAQGLGSSQHSKIDREQPLEVYLSQMSPEWREQLHQAAVECSDDLILELAEQIPEENAPLAIALKDLAHNFLFDRVIELTTIE